MARIFAEAGLGITAHAGEFATANIRSALKTPALSRIGHATHAIHDSDLVELLLDCGTIVESSLTCNVVLGSAPSYEQHPARAYFNSGIRLSLSTDDPVRVNTTIGREYAIAAQLGFSLADLAQVTRYSIESSFTSDDRKQRLLSFLKAWEEDVREI